MTTNSQITSFATFGAGCFWGVEEAFRTLPGVTKTTVGYMGGTTQNPTYEEVCTNSTGHVEVVQVEFDPIQISYEKLLNTFWQCHDPTTLNRQGPDVGTQYRSVIFVYNQEQRDTAEQSRTQVDQSGRYQSSIVTTIEAAPTFWPAEEYHQQYLQKRGLDSCQD